jgi:hypothetical protein
MLWVGLDLHKHYLTACAMDGTGAIVAEHRRLPADDTTRRGGAKAVLMRVLDAAGGLELRRVAAATRAGGAPGASAGVRRVVGDATGNPNGPPPSNDPPVPGRTSRRLKPASCRARRMRGAGLQFGCRGPHLTRSKTNYAPLRSAP